MFIYLINATKILERDENHSNESRYCEPFFFHSFNFFASGFDGILMLDDF